MKSYGQLAAGTGAIQQQIVEAKQNKYVNALTDVELLNKLFSFIAKMLKGSLAKCRG